jgi:hypothetical protein
VDYLEKQRQLPKYIPPSTSEIEEYLDKKMCKTCKNYDFYFCRYLNVDTAPNRECFTPEGYAPLELYKELTKHSENEEASV